MIDAHHRHLTAAPHHSLLGLFIPLALLCCRKEGGNDSQRAGYKHCPDELHGTNSQQPPVRLTYGMPGSDDAPDA